MLQPIQQARSALARMTHMLGIGTLVITLVSGLLPMTASASSNVDSASLSFAMGTVVQQQPMTLPTDLRPLATGKRVVYVSSDVRNRPVLVSGAIITPLHHAAHAKIVAWAHGTTGMSDQCAPSTNLNVFWPEAIDAVKSYLQKGWVVAATDYQGLGTPGTHQYLIGDTEARAVIDSVRAARNLNNDLSSSWVASGHSQGGQAVLFAGEIADTYGHGLNLKGVIGMAPLSNEELIAQSIAGTPGQGYLVMGLVGLAAVDPSVHVSDLLAQPAKDLLPVLQTGCLEEILSAYANLTADQLLVGGTLPDALISELAHYGDPAQQASTVPVLLVQGTADETIPPELTGLLQQEVCAYGTSTDLEFIDGATHDTVPTLSTGLVSDYISGRFAGQPAPSNCQ